MIKEYLKLLAQRESKVVLGKYYSNMWVLAIVFIATFVSIAFSNGSMIYLSEKMNDPFTNWVSIENQFDGEKISDLRSHIDGNYELMERYKFSGVQVESNIAVSMYKKGCKETIALDVRSYSDLNSELMAAILSEDNVVYNAVIPSEKIVYFFFYNNLQQI